MKQKGQAVVIEVNAPAPIFFNFCLAPYTVNWMVKRTTIKEFLLLLSPSIHKFGNVFIHSGLSVE